MSATPSVVDRLRAHIGTPGPPMSAVVEAGHLKRFTEAIGDSYPRWLTEAPPTFLVALAPGSQFAIQDGRWQYGWMWAQAETIYAGSSEIQRNIIAERVLGLPRGR